MSLRDTISERLSQNLSPLYIEVKDVSEGHRGHAGYGEKGESHFQVTVVSQNFDGLSQIKRHQMIYAILDTEMRSRIHALAIKAFTEDEARLRHIFN